MDKYNLTEKHDIAMFVSDCENAINKCSEIFRVKIPPSLIIQCGVVENFELLFKFLDKNPTLWDQKFSVLLSKKSLNTFEFYRGLSKKQFEKEFYKPLRKKDVKS